MIELEKTYLAKYLPSDLKNSKSLDIVDFYLPEDEFHPKLRLRQKGEAYEFTKKVSLNEKDKSEQEEITSKLSEKEYRSLVKSQTRKLHKIRYYYEYQNHLMEFDVFQKDLFGLVLVEVEFQNQAERDSFKMPDFCLVDVTQEDFVAGGVLSGKKYRDIETKLKEFNYQKIEVEKLTL